MYIYPVFTVSRREFFNISRVFSCCPQTFVSRHVFSLWYLSLLNPHFKSQSATVLLRVLLSVVLYIFVIPQPSYLLSYVMQYLLSVPLLRPLSFPCIVFVVYATTVLLHVLFVILCVLCTIWPPGIDPVYMFSLTSLLPFPFVLVSLISGFESLPERPWLLPHLIKSLFFSTLCIWVLTSFHSLHQS